jgi:hypothetical protein
LLLISIKSVAQFNNRADKKKINLLIEFEAAFLFLFLIPRKKIIKQRKKV